MRIITAVAAVLFLGGCATGKPAVSPLVYEDSNVAIYHVCEGSGNMFDAPSLYRRCHDQVVQKKQTAEVNADVKLNSAKQ